MHDATDKEYLLMIETRILALEEGQAALEQGHVDIKTQLDATHKNTEIIVELIGNAKLGMRFLVTTGAFLIKTLQILSAALAVIGLYISWRSGKLTEFFLSGRV